MLARAESVAVVGLEGHPVDVEVSLSQGLPSFAIVGLPDVSVQESRERVRAAIQNSSHEWPQKRITVNLSPAHLRKAGPGFDLAIALGIIAANGGVPEERLRRLCLVGELSLDGGVRRVRGALAAAFAARDNGFTAVMVPESNAPEAALVDGLTVYAVDHLARAVGFLRGETSIDRHRGTRAAIDDPEASDVDFEDVRGQDNAKTALEIAAAGGHSIMMSGTPGGGKTMLARRLPTIMPPLSDEEALEVTRIYSVAGLLPEESGLLRRRPFRAPHHTVSTSGLVGGGSAMPLPGEVSLAHRGTLFMDEASEFRRDALQALRGPIEDGVVTIVRSRFAVTFPARFQLVLATNPCACGYFGDERNACTCHPGRLSAYAERLSGPILDRIDLQVTVSRLQRGELMRADDGDPSAVMRKRVWEARAVQRARLGARGPTCNAEIPPRLLDVLCARTRDAGRELERVVDKMGLTARAAHRVLRVARTIADLQHEELVGVAHVQAAAAYKVG